MAVKKKTGRKIDLRKATRLATLAIVILGCALLALTGWFISKTLNDIATVQDGGTSRDFKIEGINIQLLDRLLQEQQDKTASSDAFPKELRNPYKRTAVPVPPAPEPAPPAPAPASAPPAQ